MKCWWVRRWEGESQISVFTKMRSLFILFYTAHIFANGNGFRSQCKRSHKYTNIISHCQHFCLQPHMNNKYMDSNGFAHLLMASKVWNVTALFLHRMAGHNNNWHRKGDRAEKSCWRIEKHAFPRSNLLIISLRAFAFRLNNELQAAMTWEM